jgi:hypothetical protein
MDKKSYESIILKNDKFTEDTEIALGLVKKYIILNKLIIVGGMAIDIALRLKGDSLYEDDVLPDYDFYSPNYHKDAYKIAEMLHKAGLKNISVINANHVSTMRVRVNYTVVADVTYMPEIIFGKLPTLLYREIYIIHPHYQLIDQHRALSLPYENAPWEVITHRWVKDATRYDLLYKYYPIEPANTELKLSAEIRISSIYFKNQCIGGFAGLLYWHKIATDMGFKSNIKLGSITIDTGGIVVELPEDSHGVSIYSNDITALYKLIKDNGIKKERHYNRFLDKLPAKIIIDNKWEIFDNAGILLSAYKSESDIYISNLQNIMLYMLTNLILLQKIKEEERGDTFQMGYLLAQSIVKWAGDKFSNSPKEKLKMFLPSEKTYGTDEISDSYLNAKRLFLEKIKEIPKSELQPKAVFPEAFVNGKIPDKYYKFNPSKSAILKIDGAETKEYIARIY